MPQPLPVSSMLEARSVAVVGASRRPGSAGETMVSELLIGGFTGPIYPINPGYDEVLGLRCYASLAELPERAWKLKRFNTAPGGGVYGGTQSCNLSSYNMDMWTSAS